MELGEEEEEALKRIDILCREQIRRRRAKKEIKSRITHFPVIIIVITASSSFHPYTNPISVCVFFIFSEKSSGCTHIHFFGLVLLFICSIFYVWMEKRAKNGKSIKKWRRKKKFGENKRGKLMSVLTKCVSCYSMQIICFLQSESRRKLGKAAAEGKTSSEWEK